MFLKDNQIDTTTYLSLREAVGWKALTEEQAQKALQNSLVTVLAIDDGKPVGMGRIVGDGAVICYIQDLIVIPEYQGKGLGTQAVRFVKALYEDWLKITLVTPVEKKENVKFYTEKCGFRIVSAETDGNVELARFVAER